jgi:hypothetical protein
MTADCRDDCRYIREESDVKKILLKLLLDMRGARFLFLFIYP